MWVRAGPLANAFSYTPEFCPIRRMDTPHTNPESRSADPALARARAAPDTSRWTGEKAGAFLRALAQHGKVAAAARSVGMSRQAAYRLRARAPQFARLWDEAMRLGQAARLRARAARRRKRVHPLLDTRPLPDTGPLPETGPSAGDGSGQVGVTPGLAQGDAAPRARTRF